MTTRTIWLCLRCGWRMPTDTVNADIDHVMEHEDARHGGSDVAHIRTVDAHGRITGGPRSRP